jgi:D-3-phosphoglycerate dehydrogenase / 2-oxoglutarate reductase
MTEGDALVVLLSVSSFGVADPAPRDRLEAEGLQVRDNPHGRRLKQDEIIELIGDVDALIAGTEPLNADVLAAARKLRVISRVGVGLDNVDLNAARAEGIVVRNTPEAVTNPVAELTLSGIINLLRHVSLMDRELRDGDWNRRMGRMLTGRTVGIIGLGRIGRRLSTLMAPFDVRIVASDRAPDHQVAESLGVTYVPLEQLLSEADVVTLHLPGSNRPIIAAEQLALMKPDAVLVNTSRGGLVDERALHAALTEGRLAGAYVDTFEDEPYEGPLRDLPNVLLTPHAGSFAAEARLEMEMEAVENMLAALEEFR